MKNLDLNSYGVQEMDANVMEEVNGGGIWAILGAAAMIVVGHLLEETASNPTAHAKAWNREKEAALRDNAR